MLEYALNNVGFAQFYGNSSGNDSAEAPGALLEIGARRIAQMVETSNCLFGRPLPKASAVKPERRSISIQ